MSANPTKEILPKPVSPDCSQKIQSVSNKTTDAEAEIIPKDGKVQESAEAKDFDDNKTILYEVILEMESDNNIKPDNTHCNKNSAQNSTKFKETDVNECIIINNKTEPLETEVIEQQRTQEMEIQANKDKDLEKIQGTEPQATQITEPQEILVAKNTESNVSHKDVNNVPSVSMNIDPVPGCSNTIFDEFLTPAIPQKSSVKLYTEDTEPQLYIVKGSVATAPIITKNLPKVFEYLPIQGRPLDKSGAKEFLTNKIREFVGCGLTDYEFQTLEEYCSPEHLKTGKELQLGTSVPVMGVVRGNVIDKDNDEPAEPDDDPDLVILKKYKLRLEKDTKGLFIKKLKYRGLRVLPFTKEVYDMAPDKPSADFPDVELEPGKDILYRVRVYRPYNYSIAKDRFTRTRHSVFCCDIILTGRHKLSDLRDRFVCHNDFDIRVDVSNHPDMLPQTKAKEVFPSGFLFINNVFYVDTREGCIDYSESIREWAIKKKLGVFHKKDMCAVRLEELVLKLGYPEVYVHQGNCEHVFIFSEVRLLTVRDPARLHNYPCSTALAQNQTVYCTTCAEFCAKWVVVGCGQVPFDPAFFCETCFKQYLYKNGQKLGDFKAYSYRGNALNVLKPY